MKLLAAAFPQEVALPIPPSGPDASVARRPTRYVLMGGGPPAAADEMERAAVLAIEIAVLWQGDVLGISHLSPPRACYVGGAPSACDVCLPSELLGAERRCVAVGSRAEVCAVLPPGAVGWLSLPDGSSQPFAAGEAVERWLPLGPGQRAHLCFGDIEIQVARVAAGRLPARSRSLGFDAPALSYWGLSALSATGILALLSLMGPPLGLTEDEQAVSERLYLLQSYLTASAERVAPRRDPAAATPLPTAAAQLARARRALPFSPTLAPEADPTPAPPAPELATQAADSAPRDVSERRAQLDEAREFGMASLLSSRLAELDDPRLIHHRELSGAELARMDQLFKPESSLGTEGPDELGLSGGGLHGGGKAEVVELGVIRTVSEAEGRMPEHFAYAGRATGSHRSQAPLLRRSHPSRSESPPPALIRRALQAQSPRLRECQEQGLQERPALAGSATVRFVVQSDGRVAQISTQGSDLPLGVRACIQRVFQGLSFPSPGEEPLNVVYPVELR